MSFFKRLFGKDAAINPPADDPALQDPIEMHWRQVYDARATMFDAAFGKLPDDIQKLGDLIGVWPGGGLYIIPAPRLAPEAVVYTSFGLTNPDMPTTVTATPVPSAGGDGRSVQVQLSKKENLRPATDWPGYGYEIIVVTKEPGQWPLWLLQWAVKAELIGDADFRGRVEKYQGMTVEAIQIGEHASANILIAPARPPLLTSLALPNGHATMLVATVITEEEMLWSKTHGRDALLDALQQAGIGQFSNLDRPSVVAPEAAPAYQSRAPLRAPGPAPDFSEVRSRDSALALVAAGQLHRIALFPLEFGGADFDANAVYVPPETVQLRNEMIASVQAAGQAGTVNALKVDVRYKGDSFVPSALLFVATHSDQQTGFDQAIEIW